MRDTFSGLPFVIFISKKSISEVKTLLTRFAFINLPLEMPQKKCFYHFIMNELPRGRASRYQLKDFFNSEAEPRGINRKPNKNAIQGLLN